MAYEPEAVLNGHTVRALMGLDEQRANRDSGVGVRLSKIIDESEDIHTLSVELLEIGQSALLAFLQANVTGPPLTWDPKEVIPPQHLLDGGGDSSVHIQKRLTLWLGVDGEAAYQHIPFIELFVFAKIMLNATGLELTHDLIWARIRVNSWHQRLLDRPSSSLQESIEDDLQSLERLLSSELSQHSAGYAVFLLERSAIDLLHGRNIQAQMDLKQASRNRGFEYILTGRLGKRTKYQQKYISQLVVLARSSDKLPDATHAIQDATLNRDEHEPNAKPQNLNLDDGTLLESISFVDNKDTVEGLTGEDTLSPTLRSLDPGNQPLLNPLDAIILLNVASSITNDKPQDGLTREETLPYAERVLSGGSSNWQVYTQALLVRSRIEGYKTRTIERAVLQLQALVDQVIAETTSKAEPATEEPDLTAPRKSSTATFLRRAEENDAATAKQRLEYIHSLATPLRWRLEAELAERWVSVGGLRTALEVYKRLQMWAEVALCWAADGHEDKARRIVCRQIYQPLNPESSLDSDDIDLDNVQFSNKLCDPLPPDAPRLLCILGDLDESPEAYETAWRVSNNRFARAKRSLGSYYMKRGDQKKAEEAYSTSLKISPQDHGTWFSLGAVRLQVGDWPGAAEAFGRAVQIEESDAEAWSNMAIALMRISDDDTGSQKDVRAAFDAMKRATSLKRENSKMWQNYLAVAAKLSPPPYGEVLMAQTRLIDLLGASQGEAAVDLPILEALVTLVFEDDQTHIQEKIPSPLHGIRQQVVDLVLQKIVPLVTSSRPLWLLIAKLNTHLKRPYAALSTYEKAWRSTLNQPGWESSPKSWKMVSEATLDLMDAYENLGDMIRESGLGAGEPVCKDWKFKARSAARSVLARGKETWEDDVGYEQIKDRLAGIKK